jgi:N-formylglutamate amidohydrolase
MPIAPYDLSRPARLRSCVVFSSPHSGAQYPDSFVQSSVLDRQKIRSSEDAFVDQLFSAAPEFGAPLLKATLPRAFVDLNRGPDELDPALIEGARRHGHNPRVTSGLGVVPRVVANGRSIYRGKMSAEMAQQRIDQYWHPYHRVLQSLLDDALDQFGRAILIDCHSMPHEAMDGNTRGNRQRAEVVLGDRFGAAAGGEVVDMIESTFADAGLRVTRNTPFAGAYVTQAYGRPSRNQHAVQIEIDRALYMDEQTIRPNSNFDTFRKLMHRVASEISAIGRDRMPLAAE